MSFFGDVVFDVLDVVVVGFCGDLVGGPVLLLMRVGIACTKSSRRHGTITHWIRSMGHVWVAMSSFQWPTRMQCHSHSLSVEPQGCALGFVSVQRYSGGM